jgi:hypothetical protein
MRVPRWKAAPGVAGVFMLVVGVAIYACVLPTAAAAAPEAGLQDPSRMPTYDDLLLRVDEQVPGFGGMFIDSDGRLAVYLLDVSQLAVTRAAIESVFGSNRVPAAGVRAVQGQYSVSQLKAWSERAAGLLRTPGVTVVDLDEGKNRVMVGIEAADRMRVVSRALSSLRVPRDAVVIQVTGPIRPVNR